MKTITCSDRVYYDELLHEEAQAIRQDILLYHSILHTTYRYLTLKAREFLSRLKNRCIKS